MTHSRPKSDGVPGISDILMAVDNRRTAVKAAEDFAECEIRCHMLHGQLLSELERLKELGYGLDLERKMALQRVQDKAMPSLTGADNV